MSSPFEPNGQAEAETRTAHEVQGSLSSRDGFGCYSQLLLILAVAAAAVFVVLVWVWNDGTEDEEQSVASNPVTVTATARAEDPSSGADSATQTANQRGRFSALVPNDSNVSFLEQNELSLTLDEAGRSAFGSFTLQWVFDSNPDVIFSFEGTMRGTYDPPSGAVADGRVMVDEGSEGFLRFTFAEDGNGLWEASVSDGMLLGRILGSDVYLEFVLPITD